MTTLIEKLNGLVKPEVPKYAITVSNRKYKVLSKSVEMKGTNHNIKRATKVDFQVLYFQ